MTISTELRFAGIDDLYLDPKNPRLGRNNTKRILPQDGILNLMRDWTLDELAVSYLESGGFWTHEALLVSMEELYGRPSLIVIEGNRRLAALKYLYEAYHGNPASKKWQDIANSGVHTPELFTRIPYILVDSREEIRTFLGFRHVTGIKEWRPAEKAEFIAGLIDDGMSYEQVMRKIGSKTSTVRQNYISYRLLLQIENYVDDVPRDLIEERFSVMYLSIRTRGVREYLRLDINAEPEDVKVPVPNDRLSALGNFARWIYGGKKAAPLFTDSRQVDNFGKILENTDAIDYLERTPLPNFDFAFKIAGADEGELIRLIERAADNVELALTRAHLYSNSSKLNKAATRLTAHTTQLIKIFQQNGHSIEDDQ